MPGRLYAIGDVHGCSFALRTLIEAIAPDPEDTLVFLGDVVDYGPDSKGVIEQLMALEQRCDLLLIQGNHEEMLFRAVDGKDDYRLWLRCGGDATVRNYPNQDHRMPIDPAHFRFLKDGCRDYHETEDFLFVHANYYPNRRMSEQSGQILRWEFVEPGRMAPHFSGKSVIAGHTPQTNGEVLDLGFLTLIDTDASRQGWLTALEVRTRDVIQTNQNGHVRRSRLASADRPE
jgi:serine/threonine protein phosphatase 1